MLLFFTLSAANHAATAIREHNLKPANLMRPIMAMILGFFWNYPVSFHWLV